MTDPANSDAALVREMPLAQIPAPEWYERFIDKIDARSADECWPATCSINSHGYAEMSIEGRNHKMHRLAYLLWNGPIAYGLNLDHTCHNADETCPGGKLCQHRRCCNPAHLEAVSPIENVMRGRSQPAQNARLEACPKCGGPLTVRPKNPRWRECVPCTEELIRLRDERNRLARTAR